MVKQIRNGELLEAIMDRGDGYFRWLQKKSGLSGPLSTMLAETVFVSVDGLDDILMKKAKEEVRQEYAEDILKGDEKNAKNIETVNKSVRGDCCLFEVMVCLANSISEMFLVSDETGVSTYFEKMLENSMLDRYDEEDFDMRPDEIKKYWEKHIKMILDRDYSDLGAGGLFPLKESGSPDRRGVSLWQQMNDWVDIHTDEDGEWVD